MATPEIEVIPTPYQDILALLQSGPLRAVEQAIVTEIGWRIVEDYSSAHKPHAGDLSVSAV